MRIVAFVHSLSSCWNNGNAHFLRGVLRELVDLGHEVEAFEPADGWSRENLVRDHGSVEASGFAALYPGIRLSRYGPDLNLERALGGAGLVLVHEWNPPELVAALGRLRRQARFTLLFHDTHHRSVSEPETMRALELDDYDGVLAFGRTVAEVYRSWGWGERAVIWHEAADHRLFAPDPAVARGRDLVWIGNWGEGERTAEIEQFLLAPAKAAGLRLDVYGVRYPGEGRAMLALYGARYRGWLANVAAPGLLRAALATIHIPRRFYREHLPGVPTIRVFEALACGTPLVCAPWQDSEGLFELGRDFLIARDSADMRELLSQLAHDESLRNDLSRNGRSTIMARHTCAHRAAELLAIKADMDRRERDAPRPVQHAVLS